MPNPVAEVVARLREAADNIERARMSGIVENLAGWEQRAVREAAECIAHLNAERLSRERDTGVPEGWCVLPLEPTREMCLAAVIRNGGWIEPYTAPRESGVAVDGDISQEDADDLNRQSCEDARLDYIAMLSAAPQPPTVSTQGWHPIETGIAELADDTLVIVGCTQGVLDIWCGRYLREEKDKQDRGVYRCAPHLDWFPTHWMPRPAAPASVSDKTEAV